VVIVVNWLVLSLYDLVFAQVDLVTLLVLVFGSRRINVPLVYIYFHFGMRILENNNLFGAC